MKTAAVYIRVSTDDQLEYSPATQLNELKKYAKSHDMIVGSDFIFIDEGVSGRNVKKREQFNAMIIAAKTKPKPFDVILVWKFSRFARNQEESIVYKSLLRKQLGIEVVSISEPLIEGPFGSLIERIIEWMDEYYSIRLSGEVTRGMTGKAEIGGFQTAPSFGYSKISGQPLTIVEEEAKYVKYIFDRFLAGDTFFSIAGKLNAMGIKTKRGKAFENRQIEYILNNPIYKGFVRWTPGEKTVGKRNFDSIDTISVRAEDSNYAPIIDEILFDSVALKLKENRLKRKRGERPADTKKHYLSGLLKCSNCGSSLVYQASNNGFQCYKYTHGTCKPSHFINTAKIERLLLEYLEQICSTSDYLPFVRKINVITNEISLVNKELAELEKMLNKAKQAYLAGIDPLADYGDNKRTIQAKMDEKRKVVEELKPNRKVDQQALRKSIHEVKDTLSSERFNTIEKNQALTSIVESVVFDRTSGSIKVYFYQY